LRGVIPAGLETGTNFVYGVKDNKTNGPVHIRGDLTNRGNRGLPLRNMLDCKVGVTTPDQAQASNV
jgi:hypothetical protein